MNSTIRDLAGLGYGNEALSLSFTLADVRVEGGLPADQGLLFFSTTYALSFGLLEVLGGQSAALG